MCTFCVVVLLHLQLMSVFGCVFCAARLIKILQHTCISQFVFFLFLVFLNSKFRACVIPLVNNYFLVFSCCSVLSYQGHCRKEIYKRCMGEKNSAGKDSGRTSCMGGGGDRKWRVEA